MIKYFTLCIGVFVFFLVGCDKTSQDFRLDLIGDYDLQRSCEQLQGGNIIWAENSELSGTVSIPSETQPFEGFNPPNYVKPEDRALKVVLYPTGSAQVTYYLWVNPAGDLKEATFHENHTITGKALPGIFEMTVCDCGLGSQITCVFD